LADYSRIAGTGSYLPARVLRNSDLEKIVDTSDAWIVERTGIRERRIAAEDEASSDLATEAARMALDAAGAAPEEVDLIIVATTTPDMLLPSTACIVQRNLGAGGAAFDINAACTGFLYGLSVGDGLVRAGSFRKVLIIGTEVFSRFMDWTDRGTCVLFGDGAGAAVLEPADEAGVLSADIFADGRYTDMLQIPVGGSRTPATPETLAKGRVAITMKGNETFKIAVRTLERVVVETLEANGLQSSDLKLLIPHQANLRIIAATADRLGLGMDRVMLNIERYGNTSAASVPIALDEAVRSGRLERGDYALLEAFGGGLTWASALIRW